jgi:tetratricopeptide (TPR) repeat protein
MSQFDLLIKEAVNAREAKNFPMAISIFEEALKLAYVANNLSQYSMAFSHLGITYQLMNEWVLARDCFEKGLQAALKSGSQSRVLESQRHLGMCLLHEGRSKEAYQLFKDARRNAQKAGRNDLPWFTHALVRAGFKTKLPWLKLLKLVRQESEDLESTWHKEKDPLARKAWLWSLALDWLLLFRPLSYPALFVTYQILKERDLLQAQRFKEAFTF